MVVRQSFLNDTTATAVASSVHISGPHANFVSAEDSTEDLGFLGTYSASDGLHVELPRCLVGNVLDRNSVNVVLKNAMLRYFRTTTESFILPAGTRNIVSASPALQNQGFSFIANGAYGRAGVFGDRDVRAGDAVHLMATVANQVEELWTTVAAITTRYQPGTVTPAVGLGAKNAAATTASVKVLSSDGFPDLYTTALTSETGWDIPLRVRGVVNDIYTIETIIGGDVSGARFRITSATNDNIGSLSLVAGTVGANAVYQLKIGTSEAFLNFDADAVFTAGSLIAIRAQAAVVLNTPTAGGEYTASYSERVAREATYVVTVMKGGAIPATEPTDEISRYGCPSLSVTTSDGSDKTPVVRVFAQGQPVSISRYGVTLTFSGEYLIEGDKFYVTCRSPYSDIAPNLILKRNIPDHWIQDTNAAVSIELFAVEPEIDVPEYSMTSSGRVVNWTIEEGGIALRPGLSLYTPSWSINGEPAALDVFGFESSKTSQTYMRMRYFISDIAHTIASVTSLAELNELLSGPIRADNPLKWAAYHALNNGTGSTVLLTAVPDPNNIEDWKAVTDLISERDDVFHVLPLSYGDKAVNKLFYEHIQEMNVDETAKERVLYLISNDQQVHEVLTDYFGNPVLGQLSVEQGIGSSRYVAYTNKTAGVDFITSGIRAGDIIRTNYDFDLNGQTIWKEYAVEEVINADTLRLTSSVDSVVVDEVPLAYEIWRVQTNDEFADSIANTDGFQDMLVRYLYTDNAAEGFDQVAPAAALVGLIGSVVPHQGVSWYPLSGFPSDNWVGRFSNAQLNHMGGNGVLLITRQQDGTIAARHAVTTAKAPLASEPETSLSLKMSEEMFVRNALLLKKEFRSVLKGITGVTNNVPQTQLEVSSRIEVKAIFLKDDTNYPLLGGRIADGPINLKVAKHQLFKDSMWVSFEVTGQVPLNRLECRIFI
jgi:uncharacterized protein YbjQ (UPF0145 family)